MPKQGKLCDPGHIGSTQRSVPPHFDVRIHASAQRALARKALNPDRIGCQCGYGAGPGPGRWNRPRCAYSVSGLSGTPRHLTSLTPARTFVCREHSPALCVDPRRNASVTGDLRALATAGPRPPEPIPVGFDAHRTNELAERGVAAHRGRIDGKQKFEVIAASIRQRGKSAQRAHRGLKQNHRTEVDSRRNVARGARPVEQRDYCRPLLRMPIGVEGGANPGIRSVQGGQQSPQIIGRVCIVVLMKLKKNLGLRISDFIEAQLAGERRIALRFRIAPEP